MTRHETGVNAFGREKYYDLTFRQHVRHYIDTAWMAYLSPTETKVVNMLCSRTIYWGKVWEVVTSKHFTNGIDGHFNGTGLTKKTVLACLDKLMGEGFVRRRKAGNTWAYSVNVLDMGTVNDPMRGRAEAHRVRLETIREFRVGKARAMRDLTRQYEATGDVQYLRMATELGAEKAPKGGCKISTLREDIIPSSFGGTETHLITSDASAATSADANTSKGGSDVLKKKRTKKPQASPTEKAEGTPTVRTRRRKVLGTVGNNPGAQRAVETMRTTQPKAPTPQKAEATAPKPITSTATMDSLITGVVSKNAEKRAARLRTRVSHQKLQAAWQGAVREHYTTGELTNWQHSHIARAKSILTIHHQMPDPAMTWIDVIEWYVREYGFALQLAIPFMVKTEAQRADLLGNRPRLSLFLHFAGEFLEAYHRQHHGVGYPQITYDQAEDAQAEHERWVERRDTAAVTGDTGLPVHMRTDDELMAEARDTAPDNAAVAQQVREADAFDEIEARMRDDGASEAEVRREMQRADGLMHRARGRDEYEVALQAVQDDQRAAVREHYGEDLTDAECDELLREMYED